MNSVFQLFAKFATTSCCRALSPYLDLQPEKKLTDRLQLPLLPIWARGMNFEMTVFT